jgi:hypothetical protein
MEIRLEAKQMKLNKQTLKRIIAEELEAMIGESEKYTGMDSGHPDYDMVAGLISRVLMTVLMQGKDIDSAMDSENVPEEHREYVRERVMAMSGK